MVKVSPSSWVVSVPPNIRSVPSSGSHIVDEPRRWMQPSRSEEARIIDFHFFFAIAKVEAFIILLFLGAMAFGD